MWSQALEWNNRSRLSLPRDKMIWWLLLNRGMIPNWFIILKSTPRLTKLSQWVRGGARWLLVRIMFTMQAQRSGDKMLWDEATDRDTDQDKMPLQVTCWLALLRREGKLTSDYLVLSPYWRHQASHWPLLTAPLDDINDQMILPNHASPRLLAVRINLILGLKF